MSGKTIKTSEAPQAIGSYSQAVEADGFVFCSGQIGLDPDSGELVHGGIVAETERVIKNLQAVLKEAKCSLKDVVKTTVFLRKMSDFQIINEIYGNYFLIKPARSTVGVSDLPKGG